MAGRYSFLSRVEVCIELVIDDAHNLLLCGYVLGKNFFHLRGHQNAICKIALQATPLVAILSVRALSEELFH
jgi:hypothetical protein